MVRLIGMIVTLGFAGIAIYALFLADFVAWIAAQMYPIMAVLGK